MTDDHSTLLPTTQLPSFTSTSYIIFPAKICSPPSFIVADTLVAVSQKGSGENQDGTTRNTEISEYELVGQLIEPKRGPSWEEMQSISLKNSDFFRSLLIITSLV